MYTRVYIYFKTERICKIIGEDVCLEDYENFNSNIKKVVNYILHTLKFSKFTRRYNGKGEFAFSHWSFFKGEPRVVFKFQFVQNKRGLKQLTYFTKDFLKFAEERTPLKIEYGFKVNYFKDPISPC